MSTVADKRRTLAALAAERGRTGGVRRFLGWAIAALVLLLVAALPVLWAGGFFSTPPVVAEVRRLVDQQVAECDRVARGEAAYGAVPDASAVFERMRDVPRGYRAQVGADVGRLWEARERAETGSYFALPPGEREAELDRRIRAEEERRRRWETERAAREQSRPAGERQAGTAGTGGAAAAPATAPSAGVEQARLERSKRRLDTTTPEERAKRAEYRRALDARRAQMGLPAGGRRG